MNKEYFVEKCQENKCLRKCKIIKSCKNISRQERCFEKYNNKKVKDLSEKIQTDIEKKEEQEKIKKINVFVKERDGSCLVTKLLTKKEIHFLNYNFVDWKFLNKKEDCAHILPQTSFEETKYDPENIFLCGRFFHERLDGYLDLITGLFVGKEGRKKQIEKIMRENKYWKQKDTYDGFEQKKTINKRRNERTSLFSDK